MKSIPVEQLDEKLSKALETQAEHEAIGLTRNSDTVAWVLRVPEALKGAEADAVSFSERGSDRVLVVVHAKHGPSLPVAPRVPVFGAGRGTLTVVSEDDEHLNDFQEYMK